VSVLDNEDSKNKIELQIIPKISVESNKSKPSLEDVVLLQK